MDYRERKRLEHEIDRGVPNVGIRKVDAGAYKRENRMLLVKGGGIGLTLGGAAGLGYIRSVDVFHQSPLGLFPDDYVLVVLGLLVGGPVIGAALGWLIDQEASRQRKSGKVD